MIAQESWLSTFCNCYMTPQLHTSSQICASSTHRSNSKAARTEVLLSFYQPIIVTKTVTCTVTVPPISRSHSHGVSPNHASQDPDSTTPDQDVGIENAGRCLAD